MERFLSLKVPSKRLVDRAIIVEDSHLLTPEAQNALLKTLEEPPAGTILLLTATHEQTLLPTIRSRTQVLAVRRPAQADLRAHFVARGFKEVDIKQAYAMSGGLPGLMQALLGDEEHPLRAAAQQARELLGQSLFERLVTIDALSKQRELAADTIAMLQQMAHLSLRSATGAAAKRWQKILKASYEAADALQSSAQLKLVLTDMVLCF
jgi:DNA polymerase-3 subunit delta'